MLFSVTDDLADKVQRHAQAALWKFMLEEFASAVAEMKGFVVSRQEQSSYPTDAQLDEIGCRLILARNKFISPLYERSINSLQIDIDEHYARAYAKTALSALKDEGIYFFFPPPTESKRIAENAVVRFKDSQKKSWEIYNTIHEEQSLF